jgi:tRNA threonylcarbamoyladenosine biosynthesis protein TsaB
MLVLAIDTCEARGSVAALIDGVALETVVHEAGEEYSSWLLPAVERALGAVFKSIEEVDLFTVATGPGSFTGVRIGLTTVKAWGEVFGKPIAAVSRLEVVASEARSNDGLVAAVIDGGRGQGFGALHRWTSRQSANLLEEMVLPVEEFVALVGQTAGGERVEWVSIDPQMLEALESWKVRGEQVAGVSSVLAPLIGKMGIEKAGRGELVDALRLDANYVRRSYVEAFNKGGAEGSRK